MIFVGIDPGLTGAIAIHDGAQLVAVYDMPISGKEVDAAQMIVLLRENFYHRLGREGRPIACLIEQPRQMGQGAKAKLEALFERYGVVRGVLAAIGWPLDRIAPGVWKQRVGITAPGASDAEKKDLARRRASELMPEGAGFWPLKKHHGRAEAALLAWLAAQRAAKMAAA